MYQEYLNQLQSTIAPLTTEELKDLLNNDEKLDEKIDEVIVDLKAQKETLLTENRTRAEANIDKEPQIFELRGKVNELMEECKAECNKVQDLLKEIKDKSGSTNQETALALLQTAAAECEENSEVIVKKLTDNEIGVEAFLEEFLEARKLMHLRKLKAEKMQELIRKQAQQAAGQRNFPGIGGGGGGNAIPNYSNLPSSGFYPTPPQAQFGSNVPYPLGPMQMPLPPRPY